MIDGDLFGVEFGLFVLIGVLGGAHCIGMCGPLVTVYSRHMRPVTPTDPGGESSPNTRSSVLTLHQVRQHALFNLGRAGSYTLLGIAFGALGAGVYVGLEAITTTAELIRGVVGIAIGAIIIGVGLSYLTGWFRSDIHVPGVQRLTAWITHRLDQFVNGPGILGLGAVHGFLPCPILYPAYLYAFAIGSPVGGGVALAALGIGTIPAVFLYGTLIESVDVVHRRRLHRLLGIAFIVLGYVLFAHGLMHVGIGVPHPELPFWDVIDLQTDRPHALP